MSSCPTSPGAGQDGKGARQSGTGMPLVNLIWAQTPTGVIGAGGSLPWHIPEDLSHFQRLTLGHPVVMGRRTWESLPERFRPLPERTNIVLTRQKNVESPAGVHYVYGSDDSGALESALRFAARCPGGHLVWVIGGEGVFQQALPYATCAEVTYVDLDNPGDTYAPFLDLHQWSLVHRDPVGGWRTSSSGIRFHFTRWERQEPH